MTLVQNPLAHARDLADRGKLQRAIAAYKKAIARDPSNPDPLNEVAVLLVDRGQHRQALELLQRVRNLRPDDPASHLNLGEVARLDGKYTEALDHYRAMVALAPNDADGHFGIGEMLLTLGRADEALGPLARAHQLAPRDEEILNALGLAHSRNDDYGEAVNALEKAVALKRDYFDAWVNYAYALSSLEKWRRAAHAFERAQSLGALPCRQLTRWAHCLANLHEHERARELVEKALADDPNYGRAHVVRGVLLQYEGDFDAAEGAHRQALACDPSLAEAHEQLSQMRRLSIDDADSVQAILEGETNRVQHRISAGFALSRLYHQAKDYDGAFAALALANKLKSAELPFDPDAHRNFIDRLINVYTADFFKARQGEGLDDETPVFVLGLPRSGTTLTETVLAADPDVFAGGERGDFQEFVRTLNDYPEMVETVGSDWAARGAADILAKMRSAGGAHRHVTNKTPGNYVCVGLIHWLFPKARIIHTRRDPIDVGLSCFEQNFRGGWSFAYDLEAFGFAYKQYQRLMDHWHEVLPGVMLDVQYEDLVANPEPAARRIVDFCGLEWRDSFVDTHKVKRAVDTASFWQVRQPINTNSVAKWRKYEKHLKPLIRALEAE